MDLEDLLKVVPLTEHIDVEGGSIVASKDHDHQHQDNVE